MRSAILVLAAAALLALPAGALAAKCAPPGNSGIDQYVETIPGAGCNHGNGGGSGHHGGGSLPPGTAKQLHSQGPVGQAVGELVSSTGTAPSGADAGTGGTSAAGSGASGSGTSGAPSGGGAAPGGGGSHAPGAGGGSGQNAPAAHASGLLNALFHPIASGSSHDGGVGILLPALLLAALVIAVGAVVLRRLHPRLGS